MNDITLVRTIPRSILNVPVRDGFSYDRPLIDVVRPINKNIERKIVKIPAVFVEEVEIVGADVDFDHRVAIRPIEILSSDEKIHALERALMLARTELRRERYAKKPKSDESLMAFVAILILTTFVLGFLASFDIVAAISGR